MALINKCIGDLRLKFANVIIYPTLKFTWILETEGDVILPVQEGSTDTPNGSAFPETLRLSSFGTCQSLRMFCPLTL